MFSDAVRTITITDGVRTLEFTGKCNRCGQCCIDLMRMPHMLNEKTGVCKYLMEENASGERLCRIRLAMDKEDVEYLKTVPKKDMDYYLDNCEPFPSPEKELGNIRTWLERIIGPGVWPKERCGYTAEVR